MNKNRHFVEFDPTSKEDIVAAAKELSRLGLQMQPGAPGAGRIASSIESNRDLFEINVTMRVEFRKLTDEELKAKQ